MNYQGEQLDLLPQASETRPDRVAPFIFIHPDGGAKYIEFWCFEKIGKQNESLLKTIRNQEKELDRLRSEVADLKLASQAAEPS